MGNETMGGYQTVVVGTDGSETSFGAVERAAALAAGSDATLVIACAYIPEKPDPAVQDALGDEAFQVVGSTPADTSVSYARDRAAAAGATKIETKVVQGKPAETLRAIVDETKADLVVVGNVGLNTLTGRLVGSVPMDILRHSTVDVLVVHTT